MLKVPHKKDVRALDAIMSSDKQSAFTTETQDRRTHLVSTSPKRVKWSVQWDIAEMD